MLFQINPSFTKKNQLKIELIKNILNNKLKLCFSLDYSIKSIQGANITKQIGRYYELEILKHTILLNLQVPKIGSYNKSCGPEGAFLINKKNEPKKVYVNELLFEDIIKKPKYADLKIEKNFVPIIPEPLKYN